MLKHPIHFARENLRRHMACNLNVVLKHARGMLTKGERNFLASNFRDRNNSFINLTIGDIIWDSSLRKKKPKDSFWVEGRNEWRES